LLEQVTEEKVIKKQQIETRCWKQYGSMWSNAADHQLETLMSREKFWCWAISLKVPSCGLRDRSAAVKLLPLPSLHVPALSRVAASSAYHPAHWLKSTYRQRLTTFRLTTAISCTFMNLYVVYCAPKANSV